MDILWGVGGFPKYKVWTVSCFSVGKDMAIHVTSYHSLTYMDRNATHMSHSTLQAGIFSIL